MAEHVGEARVYYYTRGRELSRSSKTNTGGVGH